jgi:O-antigen/teichoic acid export membrane protein
MWKPSSLVTLVTWNRVGHLMDAIIVSLKDKRWQVGLLTLFTELLVLLSGLLTLRFAGQLLGTTGFGEYAVAKRAMSIITFPILLGLGISIPRYVAFRDGSSKNERSNSLIYLLAGMVISAPLVLFFSIIALRYPLHFTRIFFGAPFYEAFAFPIVLITIGLYMQTLIYGYLRGLLAMGVANLFRLLVVGVVPPIAILFSTMDVFRSLIITGWGWIIFSFVFGVYLILDHDFSNIQVEILPQRMYELLRYGVPRVPGEFALFGIFAVSTFIVSHKSGIEAAGFFSFGVSLLQLVGAVFATIGILLLPYISRLRAGQNWHTIRTRVFGILLGSTLVAICIVIGFQLTLNLIVPLWMGESFNQAIDVSRWLLWGAIPYVIYLVLRNPIDAVATYPYNSVNLMIVFITSVTLMWFSHELVLPQAVMFLALVALSVLTIISWLRSITSEEQHAGLKVTEIQVILDREGG